MPGRSHGSESFVAGSTWGTQAIFLASQGPVRFGGCRRNHGAWRAPPSGLGWGGRATLRRKLGEVARRRHRSSTAATRHREATDVDVIPCHGSCGGHDSARTWSTHGGSSARNSRVGSISASPRRARCSEPPQRSSVTSGPCWRSAPRTPDVAEPRLDVSRLPVPLATRRAAMKSCSARPTASGEHCAAMRARARAAYSLRALSSSTRRPIASASAGASPIGTTTPAASAPSPTSSATPRGARCHHRQSARHRLHQRHRLTLLPRRQEVEVCRRQVTAHLGAVQQVLVDTQHRPVARDATREPLSVWSGADHEQAQVDIGRPRRTAVHASSRTSSPFDCTSMRPCHMARTASGGRPSAARPASRSSGNQTSRSIGFGTAAMRSGAMVARADALPLARRRDDDTGGTRQRRPSYQPLVAAGLEVTALERREHRKPVSAPTATAGSKRARLVLLAEERRRSPRGARAVVSATSGVAR